MAQSFLENSRHLTTQELDEQKVAFLLSHMEGDITNEEFIEFLNCDLPVLQYVFSDEGGSILTRFNLQEIDLCRVNDIKKLQAIAYCVLPEFLSFAAISTSSVDMVWSLSRISDFVNALHAFGADVNQVILEANSNRGLLEAILNKWAAFHHIEGIREDLQDNILELMLSYGAMRYYAMGGHIRALETFNEQKISAILRAEALLIYEHFRINPQEIARFSAAQIIELTNDEAFSLYQQGLSLEQAAHQFWPDLIFDETLDMMGADLN